MRNRITLLSLTFITLGGSAMAAIPDGAAPADKSTYQRAPAIDCDPPTCTMIRGKAPGALPPINDPNIRGSAPRSKSTDPTDEYLQAKAPDSSKPPLYRASPMINDPVTGTLIRGKAPVSTSPLIHAAPPTSSSGN